MKVRVKTLFQENLSDVEFTTYVVTTILCPDDTDNYITPPMIYHYIFKDPDLGRKKREPYIKAFSSLFTNGYISGRKISSSAYYIDRPTVDGDKYYITVGTNELRKIFSSNKKNMAALLVVFCAVLYTRSSKTKYKVCNVSIAKLSSLTNKGSATVLRCLDDLVDLGVLYRKKRGQRQSTLYCLPEDREVADAYGETSSPKTSKPSAEPQAQTSAQLNATATQDDFVKVFGNMNAAANAYACFYDYETPPTIADLIYFRDTHEMPEKYRRHD